jgi:hypothetical protein
MDDEVLRALADANCDTIFFGIESGSDRVLGRIRKRFSSSDALAVVRRSLEYMKAHVSFIWGFPFEELEDLYDTVIALLAMNNMGAEPHLNMLVPLPSAEMNREFADRRKSLRAWEIGWDWAMMENYEYGEMLHDLINRHPDVFAPFYCLDSPDFDHKVKLLESWGLGLGKPRAPKQRMHGRLPDNGQMLLPDSRLPSLSEGVVLRRVGNKDFLLDLSDCFLYEPGPKSTELFHACRRGDTLGEALQRLVAATGCSTENARHFVMRTLRKFADRGFL